MSSDASFCPLSFAAPWILLKRMLSKFLLTEITLFFISIIACIFCDSTKNIINYKGKNICPDCIKKLKEKV